MFVLLLMGYSFALRKGKRALSAIVGLASFILYQVQVTYSGNYGWSKLFYHSFIGSLIAPASQEVSVPFDVYLAVLRSQSQLLLAPGTFYKFILLVLLSLLALKLLFKPPYFFDKKFQALSVTLVFICAHWLIFPAQKERVMAGSFLFILLMLAVGIQKRLKAAPGKATQV